MNEVVPTPLSTRWLLLTSSFFTKPPGLIVSSCTKATRFLVELFTARGQLWGGIFGGGGHARDGFGAGGREESEDVSRASRRDVIPPHLFLDQPCSWVAESKLI